MTPAVAALAAVLLLAALPAGGQQQDRQAPGGIAPTYTDRQPVAIPNAEAIDRRFWAPGLDEGYVPQGVTLAPDGAVLVSGYRSADPKVGGGPSRIWAIDPATGAVRGTFDLPEGFAHAGGIAMGADGRLWVADTRLLGRFALAGSLAAGGLVAAERRWVLAEPLRGSFLSRHGGRLWIGGWNPDGEGRMFALDEATVEAADALDERHASRSFAIPSRAQGAAFDGAGALWVARSSSRIGQLLKLDPADGRVLATYETAIGIEDLGFDADGKLWSVSEAGSRRWLGWSAFHPLLFRLDPQRLR